MSRRYFGTDGVRGVAGEFVTAELTLALARAATARVAARAGHAPRVLVIRDTRESGSMLEAAVAAGVAAAGGEVLLGGVLPTPGAPLLIGRYDQRDRTLTVASAGHPPPLIAPRCGEAAYLDVEPGPPLGVPLDGALFAASTVTVPARANLVLFTDGLVEDRDQSITTGLERLRAAASRVDLRPDAMADRLLDATGRVRGGRDDVALLVLQHE